MNTGTKVQIGVFVGICVVAISLIIWGVGFGGGTDGNSDEDWMELCWTPTGQSNFDLDACGDTVEVLDWHQRELTVRNVREEYDELVKDVTDEWNTRIGCNVFRVIPFDSEERPDVTISFEVPMTTGRDSPGGDTSFRRDATGNLSAYIQIFAAAMNANIRRLVVMHELGHSLGLGHDYFRGSIMRTQQRDDLGIAQITQNDIEILRARYCQ